MVQDTVTLEVVKMLIQNQAEAFKSSFVMLIQDVRDELKSVKTEINDLKVSLQFTQAQVDEDQKKADIIDTKIALHTENLNMINDHADNVESQLEYIENQSRRNNIKILGIEENKDEEKTWDDTEEVVRKALKDKLNLEENFEIERCHRIKSGNKNPRFANQPRPIVAKFCKWKDKESILRKARSLKPEGVKFFPDYTKRTLEKRALQKDKLIAACAEGKVAYFVMDKLVIKEGHFSSGRQSQDPAENQKESLQTVIQKYLLTLSDAVSFTESTHKVCCVTSYLCSH